MKSLRDVVEMAVRLGGVSAGAEIPEVVDAVMAGVHEQAGREFEAKIEQTKDKVYAEFRGADGEWSSSWGDKAKVLNFIAERLGILGFRPRVSADFVLKLQDNGRVGIWSGGRADGAELLLESFEGDIKDAMECLEKELLDLQEQREKVYRVENGVRRDVSVAPLAAGAEISLGGAEPYFGAAAEELGMKAPGTFRYPHDRCALADEVDADDFEYSKAQLLPRRAPGIDFDTSAKGPKWIQTFGRAERPERAGNLQVNIAENLRRRVMSHPVPDLPTDLDEFRNMSAERAAFIAWMNGIPLEPHEETGCGIEECCPTIAAMAREERRDRIVFELMSMKPFLKRNMESSLRQLTTAQLEQVLSLAKP